ncbi:MAG: phospholipase D family protein [Betaproteobacteria bacterium]|nr:phospholipase D family protein [Betaproteobacteria bacterium]
MKTLLAFTIAIFSALASATEPLLPDPAFEVGFSPGQGALDVVLKGMDSAQESILVAAYAFTSRPVSMALRNAYRRGVDVRVVADAKANSGKYTAVRFLANQGVPVRLNGRYAILHHKFVVIDGLHVQTGSFNYSAAATSKNAENVLLLWHVKPLADQYTAEWQRLWDEGVDLRPAY